MHRCLATEWRDHRPHCAVNHSASRLVNRHLAFEMLPTQARIETCILVFTEEQTKSRLTFSDKRFHLSAFIAALTAMRPSPWP